MNPVPIDDVEARAAEYDPNLEARHMASADGNAGPTVNVDSGARPVSSHAVSGTVQGDIVGTNIDLAVVVLDEGGVCVDVQRAGGGRSWYLG